MEGQLPLISTVLRTSRVRALRKAIKEDTRLPYYLPVMK